eukprot:TRINITY_DN10365_c0_g1_i1.p1 TRINITY_DN10365_c0_g1~~TRINITY_DN10365_c0_g1_i1.p1  ORF type:complete len:276 (+),score=43.31 TRINITY_DN10365_c0_g1_i1:276-1103(+)
MSLSRQIEALVGKGFKRKRHHVKAREMKVAKSASERAVLENLLIAQINNEKKKMKSTKREIRSISLLKNPSRSALSIFSRNYDSEPSKVYSKQDSKVFIVKRKEEKLHEKGVIFAVKRQRLIDPDDLHEKAYRELRILSQLQSLEELHKCGNFVVLRGFVKSKPPFLFDKHAYDPDQTYLYMEMEYGSRSLGDVRAQCKSGQLPLTIESFKSILFQIIYGLHIAQAEFEFVHNDFHLENVLLQDAPAHLPFSAIHDFNKVFYHRSPIVKIADVVL